MSSVPARGPSHVHRSPGDAVARGVASFAGVMLGIVSALQFLEGAAAVAGDTVFVGAPGYSYELDLTTWGWIHLGIGVAGLVVGVAIVLGSGYGYLGGILVAVLGAISNFVFLPYYPLWAVVLIGFNVLVLWAMCTQLRRVWG